MAESSILWTTDGTGDGNNSGYTMAQVVEWQRMLFAGLTGADLSGVAPDYLNELAVSGTGSPMAVATGGAVVYGFPYFNTASVNVAISTPSVSTRIDRVVLRVNWTAQTVRIALVAGVEGGGAPSLTQSAGTTWEMPLAQASITTGGVITLTDQREWLNVVGDGAIVTAKLADTAVTFAKMQTIATDRLLGRDTAGTGAPEEVSLGNGLGWGGSGSIIHNGPKVMYIPIVAYMANPGAGGGINVTSTSYVELYPQIEITAEHFPSTCTVKLVALITAATTNLKSIDLYNKTTSATVTGSEVTSSSATAIQQLKSGDIRANLAAGANRYTARMKKASGNFAIHAIYLLVEW